MVAGAFHFRPMASAIGTGQKWDIPLSAEADGDGAEEAGRERFAFERTLHFVVLFALLRIALFPCFKHAGGVDGIGQRVRDANF